MARKPPSSLMPEKKTESPSFILGQIERNNREIARIMDELKTMLGDCLAGDDTEETPEQRVRRERDEADYLRGLNGEGEQKDKAAIITPNGLLCADCGSEQWNTPAGVSCENGHGGAPGVPKPDLKFRKGEGFGTERIPVAVLAILSACTVAQPPSTNYVKLPEGHIGHCPLYDAVKRVLVECGGVWTTGAQAFVFPLGTDAAAVVDQCILTGHVTTKAGLGFFPTPDDVCLRMIELASPDPAQEQELQYLDVLEPSAGEGHIAGLLVAAGADVYCAEVDRGRAEALRQYRCDVVQGDFLTLTPPLHGGDWPSCGQVDRVVMNPPFAGGQDIRHVDHAYQFLKYGGRLVSVMSNGVRWRAGKRYEEFRAFVAKFGRFETLPDGSFEESGTGVNTCLVVLDKPPLHEQADLDQATYEIERGAKAAKFRYVIRPRYVMRRVGR